MTILTFDRSLPDQVLLDNKYLHKIVEAVTVVATLMHNTQGSVICLGVYAAMTPVGTFFVVSVATFDGQMADTVNLFLVSISVGLIYFICFTETCCFWTTSISIRLLKPSKLLPPSCTIHREVSYALTRFGAIFGFLVTTFDGQLADTVNLFLVLNMNQ
ncbi:hypothetical protein CAEBREN_19436 [Caenorhabditis brenneri]|uniref:Uncharacterized protein n=1 Tax=Caenorhabditis brenneri TaxID=135651 RepID=G0P103_CAEBE|nr:hypothetical protein CAEBREN_19436 [Caenorhabditis brenneri]